LARLFAFRRGENLIAVVPRFIMSLGGEWGDTRLPLPGGAWRKLLYRRRASAGSHTRHTLQFVSGALLIRYGA